MTLSLATTMLDGRVVVHAGGEIDANTAAQLTEQLTELVDDGDHHLVLDLERVDS